MNARRSAMLVLLALPLAIAGCLEKKTLSNLDAALVQMETGVDILATQSVVDTAADAISPLTLELEVSGDEVDMSATDLEGDLTDLYWDVKTAMQTEGEVLAYVALDQQEDQILDMIASAAGEDGALVRLIEDRLLEELYTQRDDCSTFAVDEISSLSISISDLDIEIMDNTDTDYPHGGAEITAVVSRFSVEIASGRILQKGLFGSCKETEVENVSVWGTGGLADIAISIQIDEGQSGFGWPELCLGVDLWRAYYPDGLPSTSWSIPRTVPYGIVRLDGTVDSREGYSEQIEIDRDDLTLWQKIQGVFLDWETEEGPFSAQFSSNYFTVFWGDPDEFKPGAGAATKVPSIPYTVYNLDIASPDTYTHDFLMDEDLDGYLAGHDNCPGDYNPYQTDSDYDGLGDACDSVDDVVISQEEIELRLWFLWLDECLDIGSMMDEIRERETLWWIEDQLRFDRLEYLAIQEGLRHLAELIDRGFLWIDPWQFVIDETEGMPHYFTPTQWYGVYANAAEQAQLNLQLLIAQTGHTELGNITFQVQTLQDGLHQLVALNEYGNQAQVDGAARLVLDLAMGAAGGSAQQSYQPIH